MAPVSKPETTATWVRRPSRYTEEGHSLEGSSSGEDARPQRKPSRARGSDVNEKRRVSRTRAPSFAGTDTNSKRTRKPSFAASDAGSSVNGRSYVDPWDMENYSFLRRQLEEVSVSDNDVSSTPALESTQSDFYYVPLDGDGSPQYQYKQYVNANGLREEQGNSSLVYRDDTCGRVAGVDEHHFYNDYLDPHQHNIYGSYIETNNANNPSRQSERSRYNNQDYHTYTPPSIIKDLPERYTTLERNYQTNLRSRTNKSSSELNLSRDIYSSRYDNRRRDVWVDTIESRRKSFSDVKPSTLNRRQSFQDVAYLEDRRRRSTLDDQFQERQMRRHNEKISRRKSIHEIAAPISEIPRSKNTKRSSSRKSVVTSTKSYDDLQSRNHYVETGTPLWSQNGQPDSLVYVYETARRRRKMVLPNTEIYDRNYRLPESDSDETIPTIRSETYSMRPLGRYAMTNYGHLKIDYSCSWNNLHRYITDKIRG